VPIRLVPNTSALAKVPEKPLATSWPPDSVRTKGLDKVYAAQLALPSVVSAGRPETGAAAEKTPS
jgi:hypothetical protein